MREGQESEQRRQLLGLDFLPITDNNGLSVRLNV
jgi:hypothetical protein